MGPTASIPGALTTCWRIITGRPVGWATITCHQQPADQHGQRRNAASIGLYHYTTQTNQAKETNSVVDIGYHYVAVNSSGSPIDTDGDGSPDYYEDVNGDGSATGDPTSWLSYDSANGLSGASGLQVFTPLK